MRALNNLIDIFILIAVAVAAYTVRHGNAYLPSAYIGAIAMGVLSYMTALHAWDRQASPRHPGPWQSTLQTLAGLLFMGFTLIALAFLLNISDQFSPLWFGLWIGGSLLAIPPTRRRFPRPHLPTEEIFAPPLAPEDIFTKRALDLVSASVLLVMALPLLALIALLIRLIDGGPVLFRQTRVGLHGVPFKLLKFRTMTEVSSDVPGAANRAGVTALGRHLRRWGLDEVPQLLNVLAGQMSMVGPRPHAQADDAQWMKSIDGYAERRKVKPGITGWAQVNGLHGFSIGDEALFLRAQLDIEYVKNWSLLFDLRILIMTIFELPMDQRVNRAP